MASTINASTSGGGGIISTADASGTLTLQGGGNTGVSIDSSGNATATTQSAGNNSTRIATTAFLATALGGTALRGYIDGLLLSTAGSSTTMSISAGVAADSTNAIIMSLGSTLSKTTSAWAVGSGNGGLDTGSIANNTWYYFYEIERTDFTVVDVLFTATYGSPTMPANYTYKRYIGAGKTNGSGQWLSFTQTGNIFQWAVAPLDANAVAISDTNGHLLTISVPVGPKVEAIFNGGGLVAGPNQQILFSSPDLTDAAASYTAAPLSNNVSYNIGNVIWPAQYRIVTNTSGQIRYRSNNTASSPVLYLATLGWVDLRGKDS